MLFLRIAITCCRTPLITQGSSIQFGRDLQNKKDHLFFVKVSVLLNL